MNDIYLFIGKLICGLGGGVLALALLGLIGYLCCEAWIAASNRFRDICKAESLIFEYRKNRNDFMYWKHMKKGEADE